MCCALLAPLAVRGLVTADIADDVEVWLIPELNPDGVAVGTRCNANGGDLNRSFRWGWRPDEGGPAVLSEPEPQELVDRNRAGFETTLAVLR